MNVFSFTCFHFCLLDFPRKRVIKSSGSWRRFIRLLEVMDQWGSYKVCRQNSTVWNSSDHFEWLAENCLLENHPWSIFPSNYDGDMIFLVKQQSWRSILEKRLLLLFRTIFWHCCPKWECKSSSLISYCLIHHFSSSSSLLNKSAILMFWSSSCFWIIQEDF